MKLRFLQRATRATRLDLGCATCTSGTESAKECRLRRCGWCTTRKSENFSKGMVSAYSIRTKARERALFSTGPPRQRRNRKKKDLEAPFEPTFRDGNSWKKVARSSTPDKPEKKDEPKEITELRICAVHLTRFACDPFCAPEISASARFVGFLRRLLSRPSILRGLEKCTGLNRRRLLSESGCLISHSG